MKVYKLVNILSLLLIAISANAQDHKPWAGFGIETNVYAGKIFRHTPKFPTLLPDMVNTFEVNFVSQTYGTKPWQQRRNFPVVGFGVAYTDYGIDSIYGKCVSIYPNLEIPLIKRKNIEWTLRAGFGLGYITQSYRRYPTFDTINTAIGSRVNNYSIFATDLRYRVNEHMDVQAGLNFSHVSNAALRAPNLGINTYGAHIGVRYFPVTNQPEKIMRDQTPLKNRWLIQGRVGLAGKEQAAPDGPIYPIYILTAYASKRYWSKNKLLMGVDYSYHPEIYTFLRNNEIAVGEERANSWRGAVFVGNEFLVGRVGILFQVGVYWHNIYNAENAFYEKLGGNLYIINKETGILKELYLSMLLKVHMEEAELVEAGLGFGF